MVYLLDVNVLIAPGASNHPHRDAAMRVIEAGEHEDQFGFDAALLHCPELLKRRIW